MEKINEEYLEECLNVERKYFESWEFDRIKRKYYFYYSQGILKRILFGLIKGRSFVPNQNERYLVCLWEYGKNK